MTVWWSKCIIRNIFWIHACTQWELLDFSPLKKINKNLSFLCEHQLGHSLDQLLTPFS